MTVSARDTEAPLDPRRHAYRSDLAARSLEGRVRADRFVEGEAAVATRGIVPIRKSPSHDATMTTELLFGEAFTVLDRRDGWVWGQGGHDGYVGYAVEGGVSTDGGAVAPTHRVTALRAFLYPAPDVKRPPVKAASLGARLVVLGWDGRWAQAVDWAVPGGRIWVHGSAIGTVIGSTVGSSIGSGPDGDASGDAGGAAVEAVLGVAERFLGVPYLWGGRSSLGLDCSGLVQVACQAAGVACPRDSDMQEAELGAPVDGPGRRGDLVFFPGHVGFLVDQDRLLHANATRMAVTIDPLEQVAEICRAESGRGVTAIRRS